jgi:hypothetical protein
MDDMVATLWNDRVVMMAVGAWFVVWVLLKVFPAMSTNYWAKKLKPLYAVILCQGAVWIPGILVEDAGIGGRILIGFWCGFLASFGYQIAKRVLEPRGISLPDDPDKLTQVVTSTTETSKTETLKTETTVEKVSPEPEGEEDAAQSDEPTPTETPTSKRASSTPLPTPDKSVADK